MEPAAEAAASRSATQQEDTNAPQRLWIHIGLPKTGTSAVQTIFKRSADRLREAGTDYPDTGELGGGHARLAWPLLSEQRQQGGDITEHLAPEQTRQLWKELAAEVHARGCSQVFLSTEYFSEGNPHALADLARHVSSDIRILVYLRRQDDLIESGYNQSVKAGLTSARFRGAYHEMYDYSLALAGWAEAFGRQNIVVRTYDRDVAARGAAVDISELLGVDPDILRGADSTANLGLHPALVEFKRLSNLVGVPDRELVDLVQEHIRGLSGGDATGYLTDEERAAIMDQYTESNAAVARDYFDMSDEPLFSDAGEGKKPAPREVTGEILAAAVSLVWKEMRSEIAELREEVARLRGMTQPGPGRGTTRI